MRKFQKLVERFAKSEALEGTEPWLPRNDIWLSEWQDFDINYRKKRINECLRDLPPDYRSAYGEKLLDKMERLKCELHKQYDDLRLQGFDESFLATKTADWVSMMIDAVLNWAGQSIEDPHKSGKSPHTHYFGADELRRFAVVVRDFYEEFINAYNKAIESREKLGEKVGTLPSLDDTLPPLVTFSPTRVWGPHTINPGKMKELIGASVGVVSLPSVFARVPLLWTPLAHEVFGHDVSHALGRRTWAPLIPGLIEELGAKVANSVADEWAPTWRTWTEELAADVAGLLYMGPYFAISLAALMSATTCSDLFGPPWRPGLVGTTLVARGGRAYDDHPPDLLRLHALLGAAEAILELPNSHELSCSVAALKRVVEEAQPSSCMIDVYDFDCQSILMRFRACHLMLQARKLGKFIVTERLRALGDRPVADFHSWNDADETKAGEIAKSLRMGEELSLRPDVKASHLLAGATMAAYADPDAFEKINQLLTDALDVKVAKDQRLSPPRPPADVPP